MKKTITGTYFKTYKGAYNYWNKKEKTIGRGKFAIWSDDKRKGYVVVSTKQI